MENLTKTDDKIISNNSQDLANAIEKRLKEIEETVLNSNGKYEFKGDIPTIDLSYVVDLGIRDRKRLKRYLNNSRTLFGMNRLLRFINKKILKNDLNTKIVEPKHEEIQKLRKEWLVIQKQADEALKNYKEVKGNYYKN